MKITFSSDIVRINSCLAIKVKKTEILLSLSVLNNENKQMNYPFYLSEFMLLLGSKIGTFCSGHTWIAGRE